MLDRTAIEKVVRVFAQRRRRRFDLKDILRKMAVPVDMVQTLISLLRENPMLFYDVARDDYVPRRSFFRGKRFLVSPTGAELEQGILIPGHRFMPFLPRDTHPAEAVVILSDGREPERRLLEESLRGLQIYFTLFGSMSMFEYLADDEEQNTSILEAAKGLDRPIRVRVLDLDDWYRSTGFREGDRILVTVDDWDAGRLLFEHDRTTISDRMRGMWSASLEKALVEKVFNQLGPATDLHEQLAHAFFASERKLLDHPRLHVGGFLGFLDKAQITRIGGEPLLWFADASPEEALIQMADEECDDEAEDTDEENDVLAMMGLAFGADELEAYMLDELFRGGNTLDAVIRRVLEARPQHAARAEQHIGRFCELAAELWGEITDDYNRFSDQRAGLCRTEALAVLDSVLASLVALDEREEEISDLSQKEFVELSRMIVVLTQMIISLNYAELSLDETAEVRSGIAQLAGRMQEAVAALTPEPRRGKRPELRVIRGGKGLAGRIYELEIAIRDTEPKAWRQLRVSGDTDLGELHRIITTLFERRGKLSHVFRDGDVLYGDTVRHGNLILGVEDEAGVLLADLLDKEGDTLSYEYHIANCQFHTERVVSVTDSEQGTGPKCLAGAGQAPPEARTEFPALTGEKISQAPKKPKPFDLARVNKRLDASR